MSLMTRTQARNTVCPLMSTAAFNWVNCQADRCQFWQTVEERVKEVAPPGGGQSVFLSMNNDDAFYADYTLIATHEYRGRCSKVVAAMALSALADEATNIRMVMLNRG